CTIANNVGLGQDVFINDAIVHQPGSGGIESNSRTPTLTISNSIIAGNTGGDIHGNDGGVDSTDHNFIGEEHPGVNPMLAPLADNGGPTQTMKLLPGSPCINAGDPNAPASDFDQRGPGFPRVAGGNIDIGAYEASNATPAGSSAPLTVTEDGSGMVQLT